MARTIPPVSRSLCAHSGHEASTCVSERQTGQSSLMFVAQTLVSAAPALVPTLWLARNAKGRDESRPGRHECLRYVENHVSGVSCLELLVCFGETAARRVDIGSQRRIPGANQRHLAFQQLVREAVVAARMTARYTEIAIRAASPFPNP